MRFVDRWVTLLVALAALTLAAVPFLGCTGDDDDDDDNAGDDDQNDDDAADDDSADDDTQTDDDTDEDSLTLTPDTQIVPAGTAFALAAEATVDGETVTDGFTWTSGDTAVATVDEDGVVTGVAAGQTTITAALGDLSATADVKVGADVFVMDNLGGLLMAIDRGSETAVADYLGDTIGAVLNDVRVSPEAGVIYLVDSGDFGAGITGGEKLILVDPFDENATQEITLEQDSPWMATYHNGSFWVTGNLDDTLAQVTLDEKKEPTIVYHDLDEGCVPTDVVGVGSYLYVACSGFDLDTFSYADGKLLVLNADDGAKVKEIALPQINPTHLALMPEGADTDVFVVMTGDYAAATGKVAKICTKENVVKFSFDLGVAPGYIAMRDDGIAFVAESMSGNVYVIDGVDGVAIHGADNPLTIAGALWIQALGVHPETGDAYVCDQGNGKVYVLSGTDYSELFNVTLTNPAGVAFW